MNLVFMSWINAGAVPGLDTLLDKLIKHWII